MKCEAEKKCTSLKNSTLRIIKFNTSSIKYTLKCQWLVSLSRYSPEIFRTYSLLFITEFMGMSFNGLPKHQQSQSTMKYCLKSISILSSHIHTGLLNSLFPTCFPIKNLFKITFTLMPSTFLTHLPLFSNTPLSDKQYKL